MFFLYYFFYLYILYTLSREKYQCFLQFFCKFLIFIYPTLLFILYFACFFTFYQKNKNLLQTQALIILSLVTSAMAQVFGYFICKWLDRGNNNK